MSKTPELDKLVALRDAGLSTIVQEFLDWMIDDKQWCVAVNRLTGRNFFNEPIEELFDIRRTRESLMYEFFDIDEKKCEDERKAILEEIRALSEEKIGENTNK